jgi:hypothetical protein
VWGGSRWVRFIPPSDRRGELSSQGMQCRYRRHAAKAAARLLHISAAMPKIVATLGTLHLHEKGKRLNHLSGPGSGGWSKLMLCHKSGHWQVIPMSTSDNRFCAMIRAYIFPKKKRPS